jgi:hypothetical protein
MNQPFIQEKRIELQGVATTRLDRKSICSAHPHHQDSKIDYESIHEFI